MAKLSTAGEKFVLHWGEMGSRWGINRTVAQIHSLLYISEKPLNAEEISDTLGVARSNVSNSLRELQSWNLIRVSHVMGDRRDHYETFSDVWEMFQVVLDERKRREIDPTVRILRECVEEARKGRHPDEALAKKLGSMLDFFETMSGWYVHMRALPRGAMLKLVKMGGRMRKLLGSAA